MNARFPSIMVLGGIVAILATVINKWIFLCIVALGGIALAYVIWSLVERGLYTPPTVLIDEAKGRFNSLVKPEPEPDTREPAVTDRTPSDEQ